MTLRKQAVDDALARATDDVARAKECIRAAEDRLQQLLPPRPPLSLATRRTERAAERLTSLPAECENARRLALLAQEAEIELAELEARMHEVASSLASWLGERWQKPFAGLENHEAILATCATTLSSLATARTKREHLSEQLKDVGASSQLAENDRARAHEQTNVNETIANKIQLEAIADETDRLERWIDARLALLRGEEQATRLALQLDELAEIAESTAAPPSSGAHVRGSTASLEAVSLGVTREGVRKLGRRAGLLQEQIAARLALGEEEERLAIAFQDANRHEEEKRSRREQAADSVQELEKAMGELLKSHRGMQASEFDRLVDANDKRDQRIEERRQELAIISAILPDTTEQDAAAANLDTGEEADSGSEVELQQHRESLEHQRTDLRQLERQRANVEDGLRAMATADVRAAIAKQEAELALAEAREQAAEYVVIRLAKQILEVQFRAFAEQHGTSILGLAESYFAKITNGAWQKLRVDGTGNDGLQCQRDKGEYHTLGELSVGTRDQLYFALRLAILVERSRTQNAWGLPLVLDDTFVHFDDERTKLALRTLRDVGGDVETLYFTHHRSVVDSARELGDGFGIYTLEAAS
jgi:uncharacterized protein YhaN